jgi:hypothetical protein
MWFLSHNIPKRNKLAEKISQKSPEYMLNYSLPCSCDCPWVVPFQYCVRQPALHSKWLLLLKIEISLVVNFEWRAELSDTILKWNYPRTIPVKFGLIWFSRFRGEDLNVKFHFKIVSDSPTLHWRWLLLLKIEISSIVRCCFSISQNELKFWRFKCDLLSKYASFA